MRLTLQAVLLVAFIQGSAQPVGAQQRSPSKQLGLLVGGSRSGFGGPDGQGWKSRTGFLVGAQLTIPISETPLAYRFEGMLTQKGADLETAGVESAGYRVTYLELGMLTEYEFSPGEGSGLDIGLQVGGTLGIRTGCSVEGSSSGVSVSAACDNVMDEAPFSPVDTGLIGGVRARMGHVGVGLRYEFGLLDITKAFTAQDVRNRVLSVTVEYSLPI